MRKISDGSVVIDTRLDTKGVKRGISTLDKQIGKIQDTVGKVTAKMKDMAGVAVKALGAAAGAFAVFGIKSAADLEALNAQFTQVFGEAESSAQETVEKLANEFGYLPNSLKPMFTQTTSKFKGLGLDIEDAMEQATLATTLAADGAAFYDKSLEDTTSSLNSFINGSYEGGESIGLFANETQLAAWAAENLGADWKTLDEAGKQVARLEFAKAMYDNAGATGQAARESDSLNVQMSNLIQAFKDFSAVVMEPALPYVVQGMKTLSGWLADATTKVTEFYSALANNEAVQTFVGMLDNLFAGETGLAKEAASKLMTSFITGLVERLPELRLQALNMLNSFVLAIQENLPVLIQSGGQILIGLITGIIDNLPNLYMAMGTLFTTIFSIIVTNLPLLLQQGTQILLALIQGIRDNLPHITTIFLSVVTTALTTLMQNLPRILSAGVNMLLTLVDGIIDVLPQVGASALRIVSWLLRTLTENLPQIVSMGMEMLTKLVSGLADRLPEITAVTLEIIAEFLNIIIDNLPEIIAAGVDILLSLVDGIIDVFGDLESVTNDIVDIVTETIGDIDLGDIGANIIKGLWSGMISVKDWMKGKISGFVDNILGWFTKPLDIHSPSRLMEKEVGVYITQGVGEGIERDKNIMKDAINSVIGYGINGIKIPSLSPLAADVFGSLKHPAERLNWASPMVKSSKKTKEAAEYFMCLLDIMKKEVEYDFNPKPL